MCICSRHFLKLRSSVQMCSSTCRVEATWSAGTTMLCPGTNLPLHMKPSFSLSDRGAMQVWYANTGLSAQAGLVQWPPQALQAPLWCDLVPPSPCYKNSASDSLTWVCKDWFACTCMRVRKSLHALPAPRYCAPAPAFYCTPHEASHSLM